MAPDSNLNEFVQDLNNPLFIVTVAAETETGSTSRSGCFVGFATQCSISPAGS